MQVDVRSDGIAVVTLDDASAATNVFTGAFASQLDGVRERLRSDAHIVGAVLVSGKPAIFVVGRDIEALQRLRLARDAAQMARGFARGLERLRGLGKPVVAAVHGAALGAGFELALACTGIVASDDATTTFGLPEVHLGLLPAANGLLRVAERSGLRTALDLGTTGVSLDAANALRLGLVDEVCSHAGLLEIAARRARTMNEARGTGPELERRSSRIERLALERNAVGRRVLLSRTHAAARAKGGGHYPAPAKIIDVVACFGSDGFVAAAELEARAFGELVVAESSRRLVEVFLATTALEAESGSDGGMPRALVQRGIVGYASRIFALSFDEARALVTEGVPARAVNEAMIAWGWRSGPLPEGGTPSRRDGKGAHAVRVEEIQMRGALRLVNDAIACLDERVVRDPRDGDIGAIVALGFPAFRGGPFRYVDAVGPAEILRRMRAYEDRFGARWTPAPALVARANTGERFYPD
jgi:enoyl-CoA hydratase/carnithine racemase